MAEKGPPKTPKNKQKSTKNIKLSTICGEFGGLKISSYQISEATFQQAIFLSFHFCFGHKNPGYLETRTKLHLNILDMFIVQKMAV